MAFPFDNSYTEFATPAERLRFIHDDAVELDRRKKAKEEELNRCKAYDTKRRMMEDNLKIRKEAAEQDRAVKEAVAPVIKQVQKAIEASMLAGKTFLQTTKFTVRFPGLWSRDQIAGQFQNAMREFGFSDCEVAHVVGSAAPFRSEMCKCDFAFNNIKWDQDAITTGTSSTGTIFHFNARRKTFRISDLNSNWIKK